MAPRLGPASTANMSRPVRNRKLVDYSQFRESDDADEDYGRESGPPAKKIRSSPREAKNTGRSGKNSQEDSEDSEEKDVKTKRDGSHSAEDREDGKKVINMRARNGRRPLKQPLDRAVRSRKMRAVTRSDRRTRAMPAELRR